MNVYNCILYNVCLLVTLSLNTLYDTIIYFIIFQHALKEKT